MINFNFSKLLLVKIISSVIITIFLLSIPLYSMTKAEFNELTLSEKVELLLDNGYDMFKEKKSHSAFKFLNKLGEVVYNEIWRSDDSYKPKLKKLSDDIFYFASIVDDNEKVSIKEYYSMAQNVCDVLIKHYRRRESSFKRKKLYNESRNASDEIKELKFIKKRWNLKPPKVVREDVQFVNIMSKLGGGIIKSAVKGLINFANSSNKELHIESSLKRREKRYEEERKWQKE